MKPIVASCWRGSSAESSRSGQGSSFIRRNRKRAPVQPQLARTIEGEFRADEFRASLPS
jgi:hypothetical protein